MDRWIAEIRLIQVPTMAIVAFTTYTDHAACARSNNYLCDGHGLQTVERSNRYISDGHGGTTKSLGHHCPSDPILATAYMHAKRWNYERQHSINQSRKKGCISHIQLYVSPTEEDRVPPEERLEMTRELIERTVLRDFPSIYIAHDNTPQGHCHISLCPFSEDGSHKLCMNNKLLFDLRRQMDVICVEHGYSIIECPELWGNKEYREWFFSVKEKAIVTIHPPREQNKAFLKMEKKRARNYSRSKRAQTKKKEAQVAYYQELTKGYSPEKDPYFFTSPWLYNPTDPTQPLRIKCITDEGKERSPLELHAAAMGAWAYYCEQCLVQKNLPHTDKLKKQLHTIMGKAYAAKQLMLDLDIRTQEELIFHIKECGQDIGTLKRCLQKVNNELDELEPILQENETFSSSDFKKAEDKYTLLLARKENFQSLLEDRSKEYRYLKETEKILNPSSCKEAWDNYLTALFSKNVVQKAKWVSYDQLEGFIYELSTSLGFSEETLDQYIIEIKEIPEAIRSHYYQEYRKHFCASIETKRKGYEQYYQNMSVVADLSDLAQRLEGFGFLGFLLFLLVDTMADIRQCCTKLDLSFALWESLLERLYAETWRKRYEDSKPYHSEVLENMKKEKIFAGKQIQNLVSAFSNFSTKYSKKNSLRNDFSEERVKKTALNKSSNEFSRT